VTDWTVVVEAPLHEARAAFLTWLSERELSEADLDLDAVRVDTIRTVTGDVRRYSLRSDLAESLGTIGHND
jgi:hypothetical protein